jgi:hypothetical protein
MNDASVYAEAKGEYTRQLCVFLVPTLETYFLDLLNEAKQSATAPTKELLTFQNLLQGIPDWNQDKVIRETTKLQSDTKCDYLEELVTAVFIAHTKVLSAIRLTSKQKKLQITIPKLDHFLHRVLSECARSLWSNAFLFSGTNSLERQKNLRQVEHLIEEAILQGIRGLLPVKSILREYLQEDEEDEEPALSSASASASSTAGAGAAAEQHAHETHSDEKADSSAETDKSAELATAASVPAESTVDSDIPEDTTMKPTLDAEHIIPLAPSPLADAESLALPLPPSDPASSAAPLAATASLPSFSETPVLTFDSQKPSVQFNDKAMVFSETGLEEIDLIEEEPPTSYLADSLDIGNESLPMDEFEDLTSPEDRPMTPIQFEELPAA